MRVEFLLIAGTAFVATACSPLPQALIAFPGQNKSFEAFQADDAACRQAVAGQAAPALDTDRVAPRSPNLLYAQCMASRGNRVGAPPRPVLPFYGAAYGGFGEVYSGFGDTYPWLYGDRL